MQPHDVASTLSRRCITSCARWAVPCDPKLGALTRQPPRRFWGSWNLCKPRKASQPENLTRTGVDFHNKGGFFSWAEYQLYADNIVLLPKLLYVKLQSIFDYLSLRENCRTVWQNLQIFVLSCKSFWLVWQLYCNTFQSPNFNTGNRHFFKISIALPTFLGEKALKQYHLNTKIIFSNPKLLSIETKICLSCRFSLCPGENFCLMTAVL